MVTRELDSKVEEEYLEFCKLFPNVFNHHYHISDDGKFFISSCQLRKSSSEAAYDAIKGTEDILNVTYKGVRILNEVYTFTFEFNE
jgi:hypothetical protein